MFLSFVELVIELRFSFLSGRMEYIDVYVKIRVVFWYKYKSAAFAPLSYFVYDWYITNISVDAQK